MLLKRSSSLNYSPSCALISWNKRNNILNDQERCELKASYERSELNIFIDLIRNFLKRLKFRRSSSKFNVNKARSFIEKLRSRKEKLRLANNNLKLTKWKLNLKKWNWKFKIRKLKFKNRNTKLKKWKYSSFLI